MVRGGLHVLAFLVLIARCLSASLIPRATHASCPKPAGASPVQLAVIVKTSVHYRYTRLEYVLKTWATMAEAVVIASEAQLEGLSPKFGYVVVPDDRGNADKMPCVPPYKVGHLNARTAEGVSYPECSHNDKQDWRRSLGVRVMVAIEFLHDCLPTASILLADDDTFVPRSFLRGFGPGGKSPLAMVDASKPQLLGLRVPSKRFIDADKVKLFDGAHHCGGGAGVYMSRGWLEALKKAGGPELCTRHTFVKQPDDDTVLGMCSWKELRVNCEFPPKPLENWCCHADGIPASTFRTPAKIARNSKMGPLMGPFSCVERTDEDAAKSAAKAAAKASARSSANPRTKKSASEL